MDVVRPAIENRVDMRWYPNGTPDEMTGYGAINGRLTLAEIAAWCAENGVDADTVTINGNLRTRRPYTAEETAARDARAAAVKDRARDWELTMLRRLIGEHGVPADLAPPDNEAAG